MFIMVKLKLSFIVIVATCSCAHCTRTLRVIINVAVGLYVYFWIRSFTLLKMRIENISFGTTNEMERRKIACFVCRLISCLLQFHRCEVNFYHTLMCARANYKTELTGHSLPSIRQQLSIVITIT